MRTLRESGAFSVRVEADLRELDSSEDMFRVPTRNLPLHTILRRQQRTPEEQAVVDERFVQSVIINSVNLVADALDDGAKINSTLIHLNNGDVSALQFSITNPGYSRISALLLLYTDTNVQLRDKSGQTIFHLALKGENIGVLRRLREMAEIDDYRNEGGESPLHACPCS
jgi:ankyrin repeat protein